MRTILSALLLFPAVLVSPGNPANACKKLFKMTWVVKIFMTALTVSGKFKKA